MPPPQLKILCLHGFTSNGAVHAHQVRRITKALPEYDFEFPDGPHVVEIRSQMDLDEPENQAWADLVSSMSKSGHRAWWYAKDDEDGKNGELNGIDETLEYLGKIMKEEGPFHGIWGFSQGAGVAGMLCALLQHNQSGHPLRKHFPADVKPPLAGIFFSGFRTRYPRYDSLYAGSIDIPTLHVVGEDDSSVPEERSEALAKVCVGSEFLRHQNGHNIPKGVNNEHQIVAFVRRYFVNSNRPVTQALI